MLPDIGNVEQALACSTFTMIKQKLIRVQERPQEVLDRLPAIRRTFINAVASCRSAGRGGRENVRKNISSTISSVVFPGFISSATKPFLSVSLRCISSEFSRNKTWGRFRRKTRFAFAGRDPFRPAEDVEEIVAALFVGKLNGLFEFGIFLKARRHARRAADGVQKHVRRERRDIIASVAALVGLVVVGWG